MRASVVNVGASLSWGASLLVALLPPPSRHALEASMSLHMLVQYPALMLAGALLAAAPPQALRRAVAGCNEFGISGLVVSALTLALLMIPRVLDLTVQDIRFESAKVAMLLVAGASLRWSWRPAGLVVQAFYLGNVVPMMAIVGTLYQDSPLRLCNAYRFDDQQQLGRALVWVAVVAALAWLAIVVRRQSGATSATQQSSSSA